MCTLNVTIMQAAGLEAAQGSFLRYRLVSSSTLAAPSVDVNSLGTSPVRRRILVAARGHRCRRRTPVPPAYTAPPAVRGRIRTRGTAAAPGALTGAPMERDIVSCGTRSSKGWPVDRVERQMRSGVIAGALVKPSWRDLGSRVAPPRYSCGSASRTFGS